MKRIKGPYELCLVASTRKIFLKITEDSRTCQLLVVDRLLITRIQFGEVPQMCQLALTRIMVL